MIILHTSDFYFNKPWLSSNAPHLDLLVMSGDMLDLSKDTPSRQQQDWISRWVREYPRPLCLCSGNHDLESNAESERWHPDHWLRDLEGSSVWIDGQCPTIGDLPSSISDARPVREAGARHILFNAERKSFLRVTAS